MKYLDKRLENDINHIRGRVKNVAELVENAVKDAVHALLTGNNKLAYVTMIGDAPINREIREIDRLCHGFIALHLPGAGQLRFISAVIRIGIGLERIGDYAVTICRGAVQLSKPPEGGLAREMELMSDTSRRMLHQSLLAFYEGNDASAKATTGMADQLDRAFGSVFKRLEEESGGGRPIEELFSLLTMFNMLERVSDQAKNICEETIFFVTGETKAPKVYRILFLDEDNVCQSQMAEAIATKTYPDVGCYDSAGRQAFGQLDLAMVAFMQSHGFDLQGIEPRQLELTNEELANYHVIVSLQGPVKSYIDKVPFHTAAFEWDVGDIPLGRDEKETNQCFEEIYREIAIQIHDVINTLRGVDAH